MNAIEKIHQCSEVRQHLRIRRKHWCYPDCWQLIDSLMKILILNVRHLFSSNIVICVLVWNKWICKWIRIANNILLRTSGRIHSAIITTLLLDIHSIGIRIFYWNGIGCSVWFWRFAWSSVWRRFNFEFVEAFFNVELIFEGQWFESLVFCSAFLIFWEFGRFELF